MLSDLVLRSQRSYKLACLVYRSIAGVLVGYFLISAYKAETPRYHLKLTRFLLRMLRVLMRLS